MSVSCNIGGAISFYLSNNKQFTLKVLEKILFYSITYLVNAQFHFQDVTFRLVKALQ